MLRVSNFYILYVQVAANMSDEGSNSGELRSEQSNRECIICGSTSEPLSSARDERLWTTLYEAAII